jgi:hypothetical protein
MFGCKTHTIYIICFWKGYKKGCTSRFECKCTFNTVFLRWFHIFFIFHLFLLCGILAVIVLLGLIIWMSKTKLCYLHNMCFNYWTSPIIGCICLSDHGLKQLHHSKCSVTLKLFDHHLFIKKICQKSEL